MKFSWQVADGMQYLSSKNVSWFQYTNNFAVLVAIDVKDTFIHFYFHQHFHVDKIYLDANELLSILWGIFSMWFSYGVNTAFCLK